VTLGEVLALCGSALALLGCVGGWAFTIGGIGGRLDSIEKQVSRLYDAAIGKKG